MNVQSDRLGQHYDIVIAGGGMVGGSFALLLMRLLNETSLRVLVLDAAPLESTGTRSASFDARSTALSWGSRLIYEQMGLWSTLSQHVTAISDIHVSDHGQFGATRLHGTELDVDALGYVIENHDLSRVINEALLAHPALEVCAPAQVTHAEHVPDGMRLTVQFNGSQSPTGMTGSQAEHSSSTANQPKEHSATLQTSLLVLADGGRSGLCEQLGIAMQRRPYQQQALICNIGFDKPHAGWAFERFTDTGPLAVLPLANDTQGTHRGALIWTHPEATAQTFLDLPEDEFLAALQQRFGFRLGRLTRAGARALFPLSLVCAREQIRPGLVLLGNVAHTLHPVAGQGMNLALRDARSLAEQLVISARQRPATELGSYAVLEQYLEKQQGDQTRTILFSDLTTRLFSNGQPVLVAGRNAGLLLMDLVTPARRWFGRQAMGMADRR